MKILSLEHNVGRRYNAQPFDLKKGVAMRLLRKRVFTNFSMAFACLKDLPELGANACEVCNLIFRIFPETRAI